MNSQDIEIRPYQEGDIEGILDLFNRVFGEGDPGYHERSRKLWTWEFEDNPAGNQIVLGIEPGGRIIAQYACLPARTHLRGKNVCSGQGIDSVVSAEYRRGLKREGAFLKVARYYFEHYGVPAINAFGYGFPNKKAYRLGVRMLNYIPVAAPVITLCRNLTNGTDDSDVGRGAAPDDNIVTITRFDERMDRFWERLEPDLPMAIRRDSTYLNWRYADCPTSEYSIFALTDGADEYRAMWILKKNWAGHPILAVYDLLTDRKDEDALRAALAHITDHARGQEQKRIEVWFPPWSEQHATTLGNGFVAEESPFNLCIKNYEPTLEIDWVKENWYYSIGDTDIF